MKVWKKIWDVIEKNRWSVILPIVGLCLWLLAGVACTPSTKSPVRLDMVNAVELEQDYVTWISDCELTAKKFEFAQKDIERQIEQWNKIQTALMTIATGGVSNWSGLLDILVSGGLIGFFADNIRKNGVIAGLKRNK